MGVWVCFGLGGLSLEVSLAQAGYSQSYTGICKMVNNILHKFQNIRYLWNNLIYRAWHSANHGDRLQRTLYKCLRSQWPQKGQDSPKEVWVQKRLQEERAQMEDDYTWSSLVLKIKSWTSILKFKTTWGLAGGVAQGGRVAGMTSWVPFPVKKRKLKGVGERKGKRKGNRKGEQKLHRWETATESNSFKKKLS